MSLPKEINYTNRVNLPAGTTCTSAVVAPSNGSSFGESQQIILQLPSRSYLVPSSLYIRYKLTITGGDNTTAMRGGAPVYTPFTKLDTMIGSQNSESIASYNVVNNMLVALKMNYAQKVGLSQALGLGKSPAIGSGTSATAFTFSNCNGHDYDVSGESMSVSAPLNCILSNSDTLVPLLYMPQVQIMLTTDTIANIFNGTQPTAYAITNFELCFDLVDFSDAVNQSVLSMVDDRGKLLVKSQSYMSSSQTTASVNSGTLEYIYNMRLASIKSLFLSQQGVTANSLNKIMDSFDITSQNGSFQFFIASNAYPTREISTALNKNGAMMELSGALGPAHDLTSSNFSINAVEWLYTNALATATTTELPAKFFVGVNCERISGSALLTGVSSQLSPISVRINIGTPTVNAQVLNLITNFDAILEIDPINKQCIVLQ